MNAGVDAALGGGVVAPPEDSVDGVAVLAGFAHALSAAGLTVGAERTAAFLAAVHSLNVLVPQQVYWSGRLTMTSSPDDLPLYDAVFQAYFDADPPLVQRVQRRPVPTLTLSTLADDEVSGSGGTEEGDEPAVRGRATDVEILRQRDLAELSNAEKRELAQFLELLRPGLPERSSRRRRPDASGPIDPRRTVRAMLAAGGEPGIPARHRRRTRPRRIVLLIDVSGSMAPYADSLLRFAHVLCRNRKASTEVFTIGTRLTRITPALSLRDADSALAAAADTIADYSGGTRLGEVLQAFLDRWGRRGTARGAVVVLFSDGWERGSPGLLAEQVSRLRRLARLLVWVNPHKGKEGYAPVQGGIVAVLPHLDRFLAGHSLATLEELLEVVRDA